MRVVGVLSGTSCDAIEVCICDISDTAPATPPVGKFPRAQDFHYTVSLVAHESIKWEKSAQNLIFKIMRSASKSAQSAALAQQGEEDEVNSSSKNIVTIRDICMANFIIGEQFASAISTVLQLHNISNIDLVGSHGQTVWHEVDSKTGQVHSTLQLGEASVIAAKLKVPVICDFRYVVKNNNGMNN